MRRLAAIAAGGIALLVLVGGLFLSGLLVEGEAAAPRALPADAPGQESGSLGSETDRSPRPGRVEVARGETAGGGAGRAAEGADLCVALALPDGRLVPVDVRRERMSALVELGADGRFAVSSVPSGTLDLRLGSPEQLRRGRWQRSTRVVVRPGETTRVELDP